MLLKSWARVPVRRSKVPEFETVFKKTLGEDSTCGPSLVIRRSAVILLSVSPDPYWRINTSKKTLFLLRRCSLTLSRQSRVFGGGCRSRRLRL